MGKLAFRDMILTVFKLRKVCKLADAPGSDRRYEREASRREKRKYFSLIVFPILPYLFFFGLRRVEKALTFNPAPFSPGQYWRPPAGAEDVGITTSDNVRLHGWFVPSRISPALATVVYFHGNSGNIGNLGWLGEDLTARGFDTLIFDYRGYGRSGGEMRDERDLYTDADAAYDYITRERNAPPTRVALYGQSLGTAAVADLASRRKCGAIILESGLSSGGEMAEIKAPLFARLLGWIGKNRLESKQKLSAIHCPVLVAHGYPDDTVPTTQGLALFAAAPEPKELILVPGAGHNVCGFGGQTYFDDIASFIRKALIESKDRAPKTALSASSR